MAALVVAVALHLLAVQEIRLVFSQVRVITAAHRLVLARLILDAAEGEVHLR
jgi:hypothetical protein